MMAPIPKDRRAAAAVPLAVKVQRMRALQARPITSLSAAEADELERLEIQHARRLPQLPERIARLRAELALLEELAS